MITPPFAKKMYMAPEIELPPSEHDIEFEIEVGSLPRRYLLHRNATHKPQDKFSWSCRTNKYTWKQDLAAALHNENLQFMQVLEKSAIKNPITSACAPNVNCLIDTRKFVDKHGFVSRWLLVQRHAIGEWQNNLSHIFDPCTQEDWTRRGYHGAILGQKITSVPARWKEVVPDNTWYSLAEVEDLGAFVSYPTKIKRFKCGKIEISGGGEVVMNMCAAAKGVFI